MIIKSVYDEFSSFLLQNNGQIESKDIYRMMDAYQIASGQGFFMSTLKAIIDYLKKSSIKVLKDDNVINISNFSDLAQYLKKIDNVFNLSEYQEMIHFNFEKNNTKTK